MLRISRKGTSQRGHVGGQRCSNGVRYLSISANRSNDHIDPRQCSPAKQFLQLAQRSLSHVARNLGPKRFSEAGCHLRNADDLHQSVDVACILVDISPCTACGRLTVGNLVSFRDHKRRCPGHPDSKSAAICHLNRGDLHRAVIDKGRFEANHAPRCSSRVSLEFNTAGTRTGCHRIWHHEVDLYPNVAASNVRNAHPITRLRAGAEARRKQGFLQWWR